MKYIVGIETTAHTFGVAVLNFEGEILSNVRDMYTTEEGGMIPLEVRKHHERVAGRLFEEALSEAGIGKNQIEAIAFSNAPGLAPCLIEGMKFAKEVAKGLDVSLVMVNHCVAHLEIGESVGAKDPVMLYASGANTQIIAYEAGKYRVFGETLDLGVGNFIDTVARYMGLGFPGGPKIEKLAEECEKDLNSSNNLLLLHGYGPKCGFDKMSLPWLKNKLEERGYLVNAPDLPNRDAPKFDEWVSFLEENTEFDENTIVSAESFSGLVALRIIENLDKPIKKLVMSGCFFEPISENRPYNNDLDWKFDFEKIKKNVREIVVLADETDDTVPLERTKSLADKLGVEVVKVVATKPHFRGEEEPEKLKYLLEHPDLIELPYSIKGMDVAFSGLQTKLKNYVDKKTYTNEELSYSMQEVVFAMLVEAAERALAHTGKKELLLGGGVACNFRLQEMCKIMCKERGVKYFCPERPLLVDNAGMIGYLGLKMYQKGLGIRDLGLVDIAPRERTDEVNVIWK